MIRHIAHDDRRNALTMVLELPERADASLRKAVSDILGRFEMDECQLAVITDPSYRYAGEYEEEPES